MAQRQPGGPTRQGAPARPEKRGRTLGVARGVADDERLMARKGQDLHHCAPWLLAHSPSKVWHTSSHPTEHTAEEGSSQGVMERRGGGG
jgi:hypothetical protein